MNDIKSSEMVQQCGNSLHEIINNVRKVSELSKEILVASREQEEGIKNIASAMLELDKSIVANSPTANETATNATEVSTQAGILSRVATMVSLTIEGGKVEHDDTHSDDGASGPEVTDHAA